MQSFLYSIEWQMKSFKIKKCEIANFWGKKYDILLLTIESSSPKKYKSNSYIMTLN